MALQPFHVFVVVGVAQCSNMQNQTCRGKNQTKYANIVRSVSGVLPIVLPQPSVSLPNVFTVSTDTLADIQPLTASAAKTTRDEGYLPSHLKTTSLTSRCRKLCSAFERTQRRISDLICIYALTSNKYVLQTWSYTE